MSNVINLRPARNVRVIDHEYMRQFTNEQLIFKVWQSLELVEKAFVSDQEVCEDEKNDAQFSLIEAGIASDVLVSRITGRTPEQIREELRKSFWSDIHATPGDDL